MKTYTAPAVVSNASVVRETMTTKTFNMIEVGQTLGPIPSNAFCL